MIIQRRKINLDCEVYSREFNVPRSKGCHLSSVIEYVANALGYGEKKRKDAGKFDIDKWATSGFIWESVMSRSDKLEHAFSVEAVRLFMTNKPHIVFPGEKFWCKQCDKFMSGLRVAKRHIKATKHKGIFSTPDAYNTVARAYVEWKFTKKSSRRTQPEVINTKDGIWRFHIQCAWNCMSLGTKVAKLIVMHIDGDWKSFEPEPYEITIKFKQSELDKIKQMIVINAEDLGLI